MDSPFNSTYSWQPSLEPIQKDKALYGSEDQRQNLDELDNSKLDKSFVEKIKEQAESIACLVSKDFLFKREEGCWQLTSHTPTLAQVVEGEMEAKKGVKETFGEQEAFRNEYAAGFGTAFLVGKRLVLTAAHCICRENSNILDEKIIAAVRFVFGFQNAKQNPSDYIFPDKQVYQIKKVVSHQYARIRDKNQSFTEWTDWALLELDRDVAYTPLRINMTEKVADKIELYMLGHPYGLPLKFTHNGSVQRNKQKDFFESNLDAFGGNSGSPVFDKSTNEVVGILCSGEEDYKMIDNYQGTGKRRIQAHHITKQESGRKGFEVCQRMHILRFLVDDHLLGREGINKQENAPKLIIHSLKENYKSRNTIPRLLHSALPIQEIYTELVLLHKNKEQDKKEEKKAFEEHRINSWEDIHAAKEPIKLNEFFEKKEDKIAKRLLILGRAGIGKSTLCQYIAHQWAEEKLWKGKFDALFWVPLRKLQNAHSTETASSFLFRLCCQENSHELYPSDVADYIKQNQERILFVLDGLDEVSLTEDSLQKRIVDELLHFPYWIMTSRPHAAQSIPADVKIENVGFASQTIDLYIQKSFSNHAQAIIKQIRQNPILFGLCHIPINLELVCSIVKQSKGDISFIHSMTDLYEELTLTLQRRFLEKIGKPNAWKWTKGDLKKDHQVRTVFELIESIAWAGFQEREYLFSFEKGKMENIYCRYPPSDKRDQLFIQMCESGFIQSTGDHQEFLRNSYSFLHLTFQEFFCARYLVRLMQEDLTKAEAEKFIREIKFDPRYKVVIWFIAGLLKNDSANLNVFFNILDKPKDSIGFYSALLKLRCLEECQWSDQIQIQKLKSYEQEIQFWCKCVPIKPRVDSMTLHLIEAFEISPLGAKRLFISNKFSLYLLEKSRIKEAVICGLYQATSEGQSLSLSPFLQALKDENLIIPANLHLILPLFIEAFKDEERLVREAAINALDLIGRINPQLMFPLLLEACKFEFYIRTHIRRVIIPREKQSAGWPIILSAKKALDQIVQIDEELISFLLATLSDEKSYARAMTVLDQRGQVNMELIIPLLAEACKGEDYYTEALRVLGQMGQTYPQLALPLLAKALKVKVPTTQGLLFKESIVKREAANALGRIGPTNPQLVLPLLVEALKDNKILVIMILVQIGLINPQLVLPLLVDALKDESKYVRKEAVEALGEIGPINSQLVLPLLVEALKDEKKIVRKEAVEALGKIGPTNLQLILPLLTESLKDEKKIVRKEAAIVLAQIGPTNPQPVISLLVEALNDKNLWLTYLQGESVVVGALGQIGSTHPQFALPLLTEALKDKEKYVRKQVVQALGKIGKTHPQLVLPFLAETLRDENSDVRQETLQALGRIGQTNPQLALPLLADALKDKDSDVREEAVKALGQIGQTNPQLALPLLAEAFTDKDYAVRKAAAIVLAQIGPTNPQPVISLLVEALSGKDFWQTHLQGESVVVGALKKCDLSSYFKHNSDLLHYYYRAMHFEALFVSTPLSSLLKCYKEDPLNRSTCLSAIVIKCMEENQPIFQENDSLCFYEQSKACKLEFPKAKQLCEQIEMHAHAYPQCFYEQTQADKVEFPETEELLEQTSEQIETYPQETYRSKKKSDGMKKGNRRCMIS